MSPCILTRNPDGTVSIACTRSAAPDPRDAQGHLWCNFAEKKGSYCSLCMLRRRPERTPNGTEVRYSTDGGATWGVGKPTCKGRRP